MRLNQKLLYFISIFTLVTVSESRAQIDNFRFYGYAQLDYQASTKPNSLSGFNQRRINLISEFNYYNTLRVLGDIEYEGGADFSTDDSSSYGVIKLSRAIIEYSVSPTLKFSAGKMITHFGLYNLIHDASASYYSVDPPLMYSKFKLFANQSAQRLFGKYLIGVSVLGTFDIGKNGTQLEYFAGIGNGRGVDGEGNDLNNNRAINARILFRPSFLNGLQAGASFYNDKNYYGISGFKNSRETSYAFDLQYENNFLQIQSESMISEFETSENKFQKTWITYVQCAINLLDVFTPFINFTHANLNLDSDDNSFSRLNFGLNYAVLPNLFVKSEIQFHSSEEDYFDPQKYTVFKATIAVAF